jgi:phosphopantothenoylcysteine decarboxylase/phosphopantothenate--cysteine ligase
VLLIPAMNDRMWANAQTGLNVSHLRKLGYTVIDPDEGPLAAGEGSGPGRMPEPETIVAHASRLLETRSDFRGRKIVVTAGATREAIDPVRFISNHSTGKMGVAIAEAAWRRGGEVTLVAGHLDVTVPAGICRIAGETVEQMRDAVAASLVDADALVMAAAPADFRPVSAASQKIKKSQDSSVPTIELTQTADILKSTMSARKEGCVVVGFALETENVVANAKLKLDQKSLDLIVANNASEEGAGFGGDTNRVTLIGKSGSEEIPMMKKTELADIILDRIELLLDGR